MTKTSDTLNAAREFLDNTDGEAGEALDRMLDVGASPDDIRLVMTAFCEKEIQRTAWDLAPH